MNKFRLAILVAIGGIIYQQNQQNQKLKKDAEAAENLANVNRRLYQQN